MAATVKKPATKANIPFIPNDILGMIFKRLAVTSLTRFQIVCRDWKDLIKDVMKTSIEDRLHHCGYRTPSLSHILEYYQRRYRYYYLGERDCDVAAGKVEKLPSIYPFFNFEVVDSSNGLLCLRMIENGIKLDLLLIWNPAVRDVREVPHKPIFHPEAADRLGFAFSPLDNDYKIVRIMCRYGVIKFVEVYSLNYRSWKEIDFGDELEDVEIMSKNVNINGVMFWDTVDDIDCNNQLLSFDLSKEEWRLIQNPCREWHCTRRLIEYENKLAMIIIPYRLYEPIRLWVWGVEKDTCEWTKIMLMPIFESRDYLEE